MIKKKFVISTIIRVFVCLLFGFNIYAQLDTEIGAHFDELMKTDPSDGLNQLAQNPIKDTTVQITQNGQIGEVTPASTGSLSGGVNFQSIVGSYRVLVMAGKLVGGVVVSSKDNNAVPAFNPLTGDVIIYNMDLGDTVTIDYSSEPAYQAKMSEGVKAEIQSKNKVRFTAYGKDSLLKIKPTEEPSYEFNNGLLEYESNNVLEQINTSKANNANVDKDYETGFKCLTLAADANYNYDDKVKKDRSFSIKNLDKQDYKVCVKKTIYDEYQLVNQRYGLIDLVKDSLKLKSKVAYSRKSSPVYESFDSLNDAEMETSLGVTKLLISNKAPSSETITKTYTGNHVITEKLEGKGAIRIHEFSKEKHPEVISIYSTSFRTEQPDITVKDNLLVQDGKNRFTAFTQQNKECLSQLQVLFAYEEEETFYDDC